MLGVRVNLPKELEANRDDLKMTGVSSSMLTVDHDVPIPQPKPGQVLVKVHATTVTRDQLSWPPHYSGKIPGADVSGTVEAVHPSDIDGPFKPGDDVYGLTDFNVGSTWAQYAILEASDLAQKPRGVSHVDSAACLLSALTAWQALFVKGNLKAPDFGTAHQHNSAASPAPVSVLVTGASGAVGVYIVQLAALAGFETVAASSSNAHNEQFLRSLGASQVVEYAKLDAPEYNHKFNLIVDTVGGEPLLRSWQLAKENGTIISIDSSTSQFATAPQRGDRADVTPIWFIVDSSRDQLQKLTPALESKKVRIFVAATFALDKAKEAYDHVSDRSNGQTRGKVVLIA